MMKKAQIKIKALGLESAENFNNKVRLALNKQFIQNFLSDFIFQTKFAGAKGLTQFIQTVNKFY